MSDGRKRRRNKNKWIIIWSSIAIFFLLSFPLGLYIDVGIIFRPSPDAHGHGIPIFTILLPLLAIGAAVVTGLICIIARVVSPRSEHFEYLKLTINDSDMRAPVLLLHEIDVDAGRCSTRCIQIFRNGYVACLTNRGVYAPVPPAAFINTSYTMPPQRADITTEQEFERIWNTRRYMRL